MKNFKNQIALLVCGVILVTSCKKKEYEPYPVDRVTIDYVFDKRDSNGTQARQFLLGIYRLLPNGHNRVGGDYLDAASDDAITSLTNNTNGTIVLANTAYNSFNLPEQENIWALAYQAIRKCNIMVNNIMVVPTKAKSGKGIPVNKVWQAESRFLRAYFYFELVKRYGGVPLMGDKVYQIDDDVRLPRNSFAECIDYIVSECDAIQDTLISFPAGNNDAHRPTNAAALTLKAKALLLAASPLYNGGNIEGSNPFTGYASADANRWKLAATAAKVVVDLPGLDTVMPYTKAFITPNNKEVIFVRQGSNNNSIEINNGPVGLNSPSGKGITSPTQDLVDAFPMENGKAISDPTSGYNQDDPYGQLNNAPKRDPRLAFNIIYNNRRWLATNVQTYEGGQSKPNIGQTQTRTGYYMRKFMGNWEEEGTYGNAWHDWVIFRYADVLLMYAEAQNEVLSAPDASVYNPLRLLRLRAGIPPGEGQRFGLKANMTKEEMREIIRNERRIELAFEEQRYFDIRRWKIAETVMNTPRRGISIVRAGNNFIYNYQPSVATTNFDAPKAYFYPIPYDEVLKNPNMKQNPGW
ncbi:RagB/SusD family nutrient uptake outer membrane protein [Mucilaginibacter hurinus]|uniref:RagB/SusD family nutrient uptake outer membrane protein n=1 Tax=Mucilaginibacter hurinus TaxID=2201324 RepID=A0A367GNX8_9SPHI|nr:RagB/SusD family nutrient uptake outer membrane protein [Mucilaginibacter hurinus]RCH55187.1 RagB/SusD family nutrient uptake outer membrane protein [Mucilaginibacter hurinus]